MILLTKYGYPVVRITRNGKRRKVLNFLRILIHTRKIKLGCWDGFKVVKKRYM